MLKDLKHQTRTMRFIIIKKTTKEIRFKKTHVTNAHL